MLPCSQMAVTNLAKVAISASSPPCCSSLSSVHWQTTLSSVPHASCQCQLLALPYLAVYWEFILDGERADVYGEGPPERGGSCIQIISLRREMFHCKITRFGWPIGGRAIPPLQALPRLLRLVGNKMALDIAGHVGSGLLLIAL
jgi:hypothetical protein